MIRPQISTINIHTIWLKSWILTSNDDLWNFRLKHINLSTNTSFLSLLLIVILMYEMVLDKEIFYHPNLYIWPWSEYVIKWTLYTVKYGEICMYDLGHKKRQEEEWFKQVYNYRYKSLTYQNCRYDAAICHRNHTGEPPV
jgi:hypothetical protein